MLSLLNKKKLEKIGVTDNSWAYFFALGQQGTQFLQDGICGCPIGVTQVSFSVYFFLTRNTFSSGFFKRLNLMSVYFLVKATLLGQKHTDL